MLEISKEFFDKITNNELDDVIIIYKCTRTGRYSNIRFSDFNREVTLKVEFGRKYGKKEWYFYIENIKGILPEELYNEYNEDVFIFPGDDIEKAYILQIELNEKIKDDINLLHELYKDYKEDKLK